MRRALIVALLAPVAFGCKPAATPEPSAPEPVPERVEPVAVAITSADEAPPEPAPEPPRPKPPEETQFSLDAQVLAGLERRPEWLGEYSFEAVGRYANDVDAHWAHYHESVGGPMLNWSTEHLAQVEGEPVFYPFSGPDFVTAHRLFPRAGSYTLVAMQRAGPPADLGILTQGELGQVLEHYSDIHDNFTRRGFFVTKEMNENFHKSDLPIFGVTGMLMSFVEREGYRVVDIEPVRVDNSGELEPHPGDRSERSTWNSIRMQLVRREDEAPVTLNYVRVNLSNRGLATNPHHTAWLIRSGNANVIVKAASHLPQNQNFTAVREVILRRAKVLIQDESGVPFDLLSRTHDVALYGRYTRPNSLFRSQLQPALIDAYRARDTIEPLPFLFGYLKVAGPALMVATPTPPAPPAAQ